MYRIEVRALSSAGYSPVSPMVLAANNLRACLTNLLACLVQTLLTPCQCLCFDLQVEASDFK